MSMAEDIIALLRLFDGRVPDPETHAWVTSLATDNSKWPDAHRAFDQVRRRTLAAIADRDVQRETQYMFEESCLKSLCNETPARDPFDSDSPYWIVSCAIHLARQIGVPITEVIAIVAPES